MGAGWGSLERSRTVLLGALVTMTLVQFMDAGKPISSSEWFGRASTGSISNAGIKVDRLVHAGVSGWGAHPVAPLFLAALAALFIANINFGPAWMRFRYWAALVPCLIPVNAEGEPGNAVTIGGAAVVVVAIAALMRKKGA